MERRWSFATRSPLPACVHCTLPLTSGLSSAPRPPRAVTFEVRTHLPELAPEVVDAIELHVDAAQGWSLVVFGCRPGPVGNGEDALPRIYVHEGKLPIEPQSVARGFSLHGRTEFERYVPPSVGIACEAPESATVERDRGDLRIGAKARHRESRCTRVIRSLRERRRQ